MFRKRIGARIRAARELRHLTQHQLAKKLGVTYQRIQQYERGHKISLDGIGLIADILHVAPELLLADPPKEARPELLTTDAGLSLE